MEDDFVLVSWMGKRKEDKRFWKWQNAVLLFSRGKLMCVLYAEMSQFNISEYFKASLKFKTESKYFDWSYSAVVCILIINL